MTRWVIVILAVLMLPAVALAGTTGKITGTVIEKGGETIPGANIVVEGTPSVIGTITDSKGTYVMLNIPAGTYSLKCTFIGYHSITVKNVQITPDLTTSVDFELTPETLQAEAIVVIAERPLVQKDQTGSMRFTDAEELAVMPIRGYAAVTALQAGVTDNDGYLYVRGGRLEEVAYFVDGVSQQDLQTGRATTSINSNAIDQVVVTVGGFDAEYGRVMSGIVNVVTKEGGRAYNGSVEGITDEFSGDWIDTPSFGHNNVDGTLGGPVLPGSDRVSFFVSGELRDRKDRLPRAGVKAMDFERNQLSAEEFKLLSEGLLPHHKMDGSSWQGKFTFRISDRINLKAGFLGSTQDEEQYRHHYRYNLRHSPVVDRFNNSVFAKLTYTVNPKTFLTIESNGFVNRYIRADGVHGGDLNEYGRPSGNPRFDPETLFYLADLDSTAHSRDSDGFRTCLKVISCALASIVS